MRGNGHWHALVTHTYKKFPAPFFGFVREDETMVLMKHKGESVCVCVYVCVCGRGGGGGGGNRVN